MKFVCFIDAHMLRSHSQITDLFLTYFLLNLQRPVAAKLLFGSNKIRGCRNGTDLLCHSAKFGGDLLSHTGAEEKVLVLLVCHTCHSPLTAVYVWSVIQRKIASAFEG